MKNVEELRGQLAEVFAQLRAGATKPGEAAELANLAGKMIGSAKVQVEYYAMRKEAPTIEFLQSPSNGPHVNPFQARTKNAQLAPDRVRAHDM